MPPRSKAQTRFMHAVAEGKAKAPGLSKKEAREYVKDTPKGLPERVKHKKGGK